MKKTITLKESSVLPSSVVQITHTSPVAEAGSQPQRTFESVPSLNIERATESFRELLDRRYTAPYRSTAPARRWGLNE